MFMRFSDKVNNMIQRPVNNFHFAHMKLNLWNNGPGKINLQEEFEKKKNNYMNYGWTKSMDRTIHLHKRTHIQFLKFYLCEMVGYVVLLRI